MWRASRPPSGWKHRGSTRRPLAPHRNRPDRALSAVASTTLRAGLRGTYRRRPPPSPFDRQSPSRKCPSCPKNRCRAPDRLPSGPLLQHPHRVPSPCCGIAGTRLLFLPLVHDRASLLLDSGTMLCCRPVSFAGKGTARVEPNIVAGRTKAQGSQPVAAMSAQSMDGAGISACPYVGRHECLPCRLLTDLRLRRAIIFQH